VLAFLAIAIVMLPLRGIPRTTLSQQIQLPAAPSENAPQAAFSQPFQINANGNVKISASAPVNNSWVDVDVDLINDQSQEVESVNVPIEYYSGVEDGESWSEGGQDQDATLSSLPAGQYTLKVEGTWQNWQQPMPVTVKIEQNVNRGVNFCCAGILLLIVPILGIFRKWSFEASRWKDSMFTGGSSGGGDSDDE
jgi:hypothetical protein